MAKIVPTWKIIKYFYPIRFITILTLISKFELVYNDLLVKSNEKMSKKFSKEYKEKLDIEIKKIQEHLEAKYRDDFDNLNSKFSQNEKDVEEQNLKIISLKEEIKTYIDKIKSLEENRKEEIKIEEIKEESKVLPLTTFDFYHTKTGF